MLRNGDVVYVTAGTPPAAAGSATGSSAAVVARGPVPTAPVPHLIAILNWLAVERATASRK